MDKKNKFSSMWKGKGFYIALGVCVFAAVISSALAINNMMGKLEAQNPAGSAAASESGVNDPWEQGEEVGKTESKVPVLPGSSSQSQSAASSGSTSGAAQGAQQQPADGQPVQEGSFSLPVDGKVSAAYSGDELVYNNTLADWRTHNGIDIAAAAGAQVKAAMAGTVAKVAEDDMWGNVVEVTSGDLTLRYCGLAEDLAVKQGDSVSLGQQLGALSEVPAEVAEEPHLHLEVLRGEATINPEEIMK